MMKTHDSADKYEEGEELNPHSSIPYQISMPKDNRNGYAPHC